MFDIEVAKGKAEKLIKSIGYAYDETSESALLDFCANAEEQRLLNDTWQDELPSGLSYVLAYRTAGNFLSMKYAVGSKFDTDGANLDTLEGVKEIREGDTTVTKFDETSISERIRRLIRDWQEYGKRDIARYRRLSL